MNTPQAAESATQILLSSGLPGVVILALAAAVVFLVRQNGLLRAQIDSEHEKRLADLRDNTKVVLELHDQTTKTTESLERQGQLMERATQAIERRAQRQP